MSSSVMDSARPRLCYVSTIIRDHGTPSCQAEVLSRLFARDGYVVRTAASSFDWTEKREQIEKALSDEGAIDVVIIDVLSAPRRVDLALTAARLGRRIGAAVVLVLHGGGLPDLFARDPERSRELLGAADALVSPSGFVEQAANRLSFSVVRIPNTICIDDYPFRARERALPRLLWMRSFDPGYDPEMAVEVVAALKPRWPDLSMVMAGWDEGYSKDVARLAASRGVDDAITFLGFCETEEKIRRMSVADIFINTNRIDNAPVVLVEASAMGLVVASTDVGGIGEIVGHGSTGLLSPVGDVQAMARSVERLLSEPDLVRSMSQGARARALSYDWSRTSPMWETLFRDCARRGGRTSTA